MVTRSSTTLLKNGRICLFTSVWKLRDIVARRLYCIVDRLAAATRR